VAISIHEHLQPEQQSRAFSEVYRVLRPGGSYVVGVPGLNGMMTLAFRLLGVDINDHHFSSESRVLSAMGERFDVDHAKRRPRLFPRSMTTYMFLRGWKR
jgi:predicted SAM-dependent methyltransferase